MTPLELDAIHQQAVRYAAAIGPGGEKAWLAGQVASHVPALLRELLGRIHADGMQLQPVRCTARMYEPGVTHEHACLASVPHGDLAHTCRCGVTWTWPLNHAHGPDRRRPAQGMT